MNGQLLRFEIRDALDLYAARRGLVEFAAKLQFKSGDGKELAIVVSELISNILKYGTRGNVSFAQVDDERFGRGIRIVAHDEGPPFHDLQLALRDGYNDRGPIDPVSLLKRGGLGTGLGAIVRLSDAFEVLPLPDGKDIRVVRFRTRPSHSKKRPSAGT